MSVGNVESSAGNYSMKTVKTGSVKNNESSYEPTQHKQHNEETQVLSKQDIQKKIESMNDFLVPTHTSLKFQLHDKLDQYYVQLINDKTKEVIREIPNKKFLDMYAAMAELVGIVVDEKI